MICCGQPRATRFCPECGKKLDANPELSGLLAYCRQVENQHRNRMLKASQNAKLPRHPGRRSPEFFAREVETWSRATAKWKAWADALAAALDRLAELDPAQRNRPRSEDRGPGGEP